MNYVAWALLGMLGYTLVAPLMKIGLADVPSDVAVLYSNSILVLAAAAIVAASDNEAMAYLSHPKAVYVYAAGLCLAVGIIAYYRALATGPVSVVVPIFAMFIVTSSVIGIAVLDEALTLRKGSGIALAMVAVYLTSTG